MIRKCLILLFCAFIGQAFADVFSERLETDKRNGSLSEIRALYYEGLRVLDPEGLPSRFQNLAGPVKCAFSLINRIRGRWDRFTPSERTILEPLIIRPLLPLALVSPSARFKIHYAVSGSNSVPLEDLDRSGVPDYAEKAGVILDSVYDEEVVRIGFKSPPVDDADGPQWDIYIQNIPGSYGWTYQDRLLSQNPNVYTAYIVLDNNYTGTPTKGLDGLRITAAHEFFHMIQLGCNGRDDDHDGSFDDQFLMEASSTWMEDRVYDRINDYYNYLSGFFEDSNLPFDRLDGWREYGLSLWFHFLVKHYQTVDIVRNIWDEIISVPALEACDRVLLRRGSSFAEDLVLFYAWNVMTGSRADTSRFYPEGAFYPEIRLDGDYFFKLDTTLNSIAQYAAARYFRFTRGNGTAFTLVPTQTEWRMKSGSRPFTLALIHDGVHAHYTPLDEGTAVRMVADDYGVFQCAAVIEEPDQPARLIAFGATQAGTDANSVLTCFPNPFMPGNQADVTFRFSLKKSGLVRISILSSSGLLVKQEKIYCASSDFPQILTWNGRNDRNELVAGGIYICVIETETEIIRRDKLAVIR